MVRGLIQGEEEDLSSIPVRHRKILLQGILHPMPWVPEALVKLTLLEYPNSTLAERLIILVDTFSPPGRVATISKMLTLTRKHENQFTRDIPIIFISALVCSV